MRLATHLRSALRIAAVLLLAVVLRAEPADAQLAGSRSVNKGPVSAGELRSRSTRSAPSTFDSGMSIRSSAPSGGGPGFSSDDDDRDDRDERDSDEKPDDDRRASSRPPSGEEADEDDEAEPSMYTGPACMYDANGQVIHRPRGAVCKRARKGDDAPADSARKPADARPAASHAPAKPSSREADGPEASNRGRGSCMYGPDGNVIYAPPGASCR